MKYSIIVAVYNGEKYIIRCLKSLVGQTFRDIEIIIIDDGSTDRTSDILKSYKNRYRKIKIFHQENRGVVAARESGIKKASGTYCLIVDADDWLDLNTIEKIDEIIEELGNIDVLKFNYKFEPSGRIGEGYNVTNEVLDNDELRNMHRDLLLTDKYNNLSNQIFKKSFYDNVRLAKNEVIAYGEDLMVNLDIIGRAKRVVLMNESFYHYYENFDSKTHDSSLKNLSSGISDNIILNEKRIRYLKVFGIDNVEVDEIKSLSLLFACSLVKKYVLADAPICLKELKKCIDESRLYNFLDGVKITKFTGINGIVCRCIMKKSYMLLKLLRPFAKSRDIIRRKCKNRVFRNNELANNVVEELA